MRKKTPIILATANRGKVREIKKLLKSLPVSIKTLNDLPHVPKIIENGKTFAANAKKKAEIIAKKFKIITIADDSGLEVYALNGKPGIRSARFVKPPVTSERLCQKLFKAIKQSGSTKRGARFVCAVAISIPGIKTNIIHGYCNGRITRSMRGRRGFGYDPVFVPGGYWQTFAEMKLSQKNRLSHRAKAFGKVAKFLKKRLR